MLKYAAHPMNQLSVKLVREQGVRDARGITDGVSRVGNTLVTIPGFHGAVPLLLGGLDGVSKVTDMIIGSVLQVRSDAALGPVFDLAAASAYHIG